MRTQNLAIVFTDVKGFAERAARSSLEQNQALLEKLNGVLAPVFEAFHGRVVKAVSDSFLVVFESPTLAVLAATAAQDELWKYNSGRKPEEQLQLRAAVSAGEVAVERDDVLGAPVALAAELKEKAEPYEVKLSEAVYLVVNRAEVKAEAAGKHGDQLLFRVPRAGQGAPYGGQGMSRIPGAPTGEVGGALTASALKAITRSRLPRYLGAVLVAAAGIALMSFLIRGAVGPPPLEKAIDDVREATSVDRSAKVIAAQALIAQEKEAAHRDYWYGRLQAAQDEDNAASYFRSAARAGYVPAEDALIELLQHKKCFVRVKAVEAIVELKLQRAKSALSTLAQSGGADDGQRVLFFVACDSKQSATEALDRLNE